MRSESLRQSDTEEIHVQTVLVYVSFCIDHNVWKGQGCLQLPPPVHYTPSFAPFSVASTSLCFVLNSRLL